MYNNLHGEKNPEVPNWKGKVFKIFICWQLQLKKKDKNIKYEFASNETVTAYYFGLYAIEKFINFFGDALTFFKQNSGNCQS